MPTRDELFPSKWLKAADLPEDGQVLTITGLTQEPIGEEGLTKPVISFREVRKALVLNPTNYDLIAEWHGPDTDTWYGKRIKLYRTRVRFGDKMVDATRVVPKERRIPDPPEIDESLFESTAA